MVASGEQAVAQQHCNMYREGIWTQDGVRHTVKNSTSGLLMMCSTTAPGCSGNKVIEQQLTGCGGGGAGGSGGRAGWGNFGKEGWVWLLEVSAGGQCEGGDMGSPRGGPC